MDIIELARKRMAEIEKGFRDLLQEQGMLTLLRKVKEDPTDANIEALAKHAYASGGTFQAMTALTGRFEVNGDEITEFPKQ